MLNRSYELLHGVRIRSCRGGPFLGISDFQKESPFGEFVQVCCLVNVVLQNLALPMDWTSGFAISAHRWPGVGLVLGVLQMALLCLLQARHPLANTS